MKPGQIDTPGRSVSAIVGPGESPPNPTKEGNMNPTTDPRRDSLDTVAMLATNDPERRDRATAWLRFGDEWTIAGRNTDCYDLLDMVGQIGKYDPTTAPDAVALLSTGWAAPLNENGQADGPPSEHPARRRVYLVAYLDNAGALSRVHFDDNGETVYDDGTATGSLAVALGETFAALTNGGAR